MKAHFRLKFVFVFCCACFKNWNTTHKMQSQSRWLMIRVIGLRGLRGLDLCGWFVLFFVFHFLLLPLLLCFDIFELNKSTNKNRTINQWICKSDTSATRFEQVWTNKNKTHFSLHFFCWWLLCFVFHSHFYFQNQDQNTLASNGETHGEGGATW